MENSGNGSPKPQGIHSKIVKLKEKLKAVPKTRTNTHFRYQFRGIEDALVALSGAMDELRVHSRIETDNHQISVREIKKGLLTKATLTMSVYLVDADDGSECLIGRTEGEADDTNGDKATNKAMAAAYKYAVFLGLSIPTELPDSDSDVPPPDQPAAPRQQPTPPPTNIPSDRQAASVPTPQPPAGSPSPRPTIRDEPFMEGQAFMNSSTEAIREAESSANPIDNLKKLYSWVREANTTNEAKLSVLAEVQAVADGNKRKAEKPL